MARVIFATGVQSAYTSLATKDANTLYFITDTQRIYKGDTQIADVSPQNIVFTTSTPLPESSKEGVLYVATVDGATTIYVKSGESMEVVGGGEAQSVADGAITSLGAFDESLIVTSGELTSGELPDNDTSIPTAGAVKDAIETAITNANLSQYDAAYVNVEAVDPEEGTSGTVLRFTTVTGSTKDVTIADIFLADASYDTETHDLTLVLNNDPPTSFAVNLDDLIGNSFSDVTVGEDEIFTVELGVGGTLGGYKTGDSISANTSLETIIKKLLMKQVPPTYTKPTASIANNGGTASGNYEIGTEVTPNVRATFNQNDAGALTNIQFKKGGSNVGEAQSTSPATYTEAAFTLETATTFSATATYAEGAIKDDNLGEPYPEGHIEAGSVNTNNYTFTPYRQGYFIGSTTDTSAITSATIRGLQQKKNGAYSASTVNYQVPVGAARVVIACPATNTGMTKVINQSALNADVTDTFVKSQVDVEGADSYTAVSYNVWTFTPPAVYSQIANLAITLG